MAPDSDQSCIVASGFSHLPCDLVQLIASVSSTGIYGRKTKLFIEGENARGVFVLRTGRAKLTTCSKLGKTIITRLAGPGDVLGLNAVVSGRPHGATAEMMSSGAIDFIPRDCLLQLMKASHDFALAIAEQLSTSYYSLHDAVRSLGLAIHPVERLAKLLLSWTSTGNNGLSINDHSFKLPLTHQEIADSIGSTRETVSKLFSELREKHLLRSVGAKLTIVNRPELERIVQF